MSLEHILAKTIDIIVKYDVEVTLNKIKVETHFSFLRLKTPGLDSLKIPISISILSTEALIDLDMVSSSPKTLVCF